VTEEDVCEVIKQVTAVQNNPQLKNRASCKGPQRPFGTRLGIGVG
jgi:hypothetical protein